MKLDLRYDGAGHCALLPGGCLGEQAPLPAASISPWPARLDTQRAVTIRVQQDYRAPPARLFEAWLDPGIAGRWLFATASQPMAQVTIDARVGGAFRFADRPGAVNLAYTGRYVAIVPDRRLAFTLCTPCHPVESLVTVAIAPHATGSTLALIHEHLPGGEARDLEDRWTGILYGLGVTLESNPQRSSRTRSTR